MQTRTLRAVPCALAVGLAACSGASATPRDAGVRASDGATDGVDASTPARGDASVDGRVDASVDASVDAMRGNDASAEAVDAGAPGAEPRTWDGRPLVVDRCDGRHVPDQLFDGEVALTFDDGPDATLTPAVLEILRRHAAPAAFFINGVRVSGPAEEAVLDEIVADPRFLLANHTFTHARLVGLEASAVITEVESVEEILRARGEAHRFFRFPQAHSDCASMQVVRDRGLSPVGVQIESADFCFANNDGVCRWDVVPPRFQEHGMIDFVLDQLTRAGGGAVLLHDVHAYTVAHLDELLTRIEAAGLRFVGLDDRATFPRLNEERFLGDPCRDDADCVAVPGARCHRAGFCTAACDGACPTRRGWAEPACAREAEGEGACWPSASPLNRDCRDVPGTAPREVSTFAGPGRAVLCAPLD